MCSLIVILTFIYPMCFCFLRNLARQQPVWEDSPWKGYENWRATKAVDGRYNDRRAAGGQCVISENYRTTATWRVDLGDIVSISHINIYYRTDNFPMPTGYTARMAGFFLYVSNTTSKDYGHLCFHEIQTVNRTPSEDQRINCSVHGRYVIYYNERRENFTYPEYYSKFAYYELCELEVYGSKDYRYYGDNCNLLCPPNCQERRCDIKTGHCLGCKPGYHGTNCSQNCGAHTHGLGCRSKCGNCSRSEACNHVNGQCPRGCDKGVQGVTCQEECRFGYYGENCRNQCSSNCNVTRRCDRFTGSCDGGCKPGWTGNTCSQKCDTGKYGKNCLQNCGHCKQRNQCNFVDGFCAGGCSAGYNGSLCIEPCKNNLYGINCSQRCDTSCVNHACHHETGECLTQEQTSNIPTIPILSGSISVLIAVAVIIAVIVIYRRVQCGTGQQQKTEDEDASSTATSVHHSIQTTVPKHSTIYQNENKVLSKYKGKINEKGDKGIKCKDDDVDIDEKIHEENPYGDFYINEEPLMDIAIEQLWNVIQEKSKNEDDGFKKEYATLLYGERYPCEVGKLPENIPKNRFKTTFPYDHSRVCLAKKYSNYINANYIDGFGEENVYIAAQGPRQNTVGDFWFMIWQKNVEQVVMLTNLTEGTKAKCVQYWPDIDKTVTCDIFSLITLDERKYANYCIRKVKVDNKKQNESRAIIQYHYTAWPDHGTPDPLCLLLFHNHVTRTKYTRNKVPTLVHCSAGIGRTGTYIAIDALHKQGHTKRKINIAEYVKKMREKRMNMVQTYEQYKTIFLTLHEMLKAPVTVQNTTEFLEKLQITKADNPVNISLLRKEYQTLLSVRRHYKDEDYKMALQYRDFSPIRPLDKYIIYLSSSVAHRGNYINAITLPSFTDQNAFIITNYPKPGDAVDLLRLITDHESEVVVCMEPLTNEKHADEWSPVKGNPKTVTPFTIQLRNKQMTEIQSRKIQVNTDNGDTAYSFELAEPVIELSPGNSRTVSQILDLVNFAKNIETEHPITVISKDGAALCGVFCAVYNLIQQLTMDEEIDVFSVVRLLQTRRPELCSSMEEYTLIHDALRSVIESRKGDNIYYNQ